MAEEQIVTPPPPQISSNKKVLQFFGIEAAFILILALVAALVLNYFNILSLSKTYPGIFGFFPHRQIVEPRNSKPTTPVSPKIVSVDKEQAQKEVGIFAKDTFKTEILPTSLDISSSLSSTGAVSDPSYFVAKWKTKDNADVFLGYKYEVGFQDKNISITIHNFTNAIIDNAKSITQEYFVISPQGTWKCGNAKGRGNTVRICENFWINSQKVKNGIGIIALSKEQFTGAFYCELNPGTIPYDSSNSCSGYDVEFE